jgi:hypothetical protein
MTELLIFISACIVVAIFMWAKRKSVSKSQTKRSFDSQDSVQTTPLRKELKQKSVALSIVRKSNGRNLSEAQSHFVKRTQNSIEEIESALENTSRRNPNDRSGYVYVITNPSFRTDIVKIGMTCQINPMSRVDDLYNTSTPLRFEPEMILYSENALTTEQQLHEIFKSRRVNSSREFFSATSEEVRNKALRLKCDILFFKSEETPVLRY